jgi:hypothetical protein
MNLNQGVKEMDNETIDDYDRDLAARLGVKGVAELRSLHVKAARLALMIRDKLALPNGGDCIATDGVGILGLADDLCVTVFAPRVIEVFHGVKAVFRQPHCGVPVVALVSRELERGSGFRKSPQLRNLRLSLRGRPSLLRFGLTGTTWTSSRICTRSIACIGLASATWLTAAPPM